MQRSLYLGLVHFPIKNKHGELVTTSVTNLDIHDISRSCRTFGVKKYFIITPLEAQHTLVGRLLGHWEEDKSALYNPDRQNALAVAQLAYSIEESLSIITELEGRRPMVVVTGANFASCDGGEEKLRSALDIDKTPCFLLFGTGHGLYANIVEQADFRLGPIRGASEDGYNHLSVRSAVAIYLDRLANGL